MLPPGGEHFDGSHLLLVMAYSDDYLSGPPCAARNAEYARMHGYGFLSHVLPYDRMLEAVAPRTLHWYKIHLLIQCLASEELTAQYEHFVWLDADAAVLDTSQRLHELLAGYSQEVVCGEDCSATSLINTGVLALRTGLYALELCRETWWERRFFQRAFHDQSGLERLLRRRGELPPRKAAGGEPKCGALASQPPAPPESAEAHLPLSQHVAVLPKQRMGSKRADSTCFIYHSIGRSTRGKLLAVERALAAARMREGGTADDVRQADDPQVGADRPDSPLLGAAEDESVQLCGEGQQSFELAGFDLFGG